MKRQHMKKAMTYKNKNIKFKSLKQMLPQLIEADHKYIQISSRISLQPRRKLCDLTGLPALYTCPATHLFYYDLSVYRRIVDLSSDRVQRLFQLREFGQAYLPNKKL
jgi:INO80 complex subunit C